jgi:hypothetical protein
VQGNFGKFGDKGHAITVDKAQAPPTYHTPAGKFVMAIPGGVGDQGEWFSSYELFAFDPHLAGKNAAYWTYLGSIKAGEDNSDSCGPDSSGSIPCMKKQGQLTFVPAQNGDMPTVQVAWSGTDLDADNHLLKLGPSNISHYQYDSASKTYQEVEP